MDKAEEKHEKYSHEAGYRCDPNQLELLKRCSLKKDVTEWNKWREANPEEEIWLQRASLFGSYLKGAYLVDAHLERAGLIGANLEGARLACANLEGARLEEANLTSAILIRAYLKGASLEDAHLEGANLGGSDLEEGRLFRAHLAGADLFVAHLKGADFTASIVDGSTLFWNCIVDCKTDFRGVGLDSCRMDEKTKHQLQYNRRRMNCEDWYKQHPRLAWPVKAFFWMSDYGRSTGRIIFTFFGLALIFAGIYYLSALVNSPGIVSSLFGGKEGPVPGWLVPFRAIYFSIVTMTTLGFGDMHANCQSFWGHLLLTVQVILGYVLLAALVTRIGVLFTSGVIPGQFKRNGRKPEPDE